MTYLVVYSSRAKEGITKEQIDSILESSRRNNVSLGITGILFFAAGSFIQLLEGDKKNVQRLLNKIDKDSRHEAVEYLFEDETDSRLFSQWAMAYSHIDEDEMKVLGGTFGVEAAKEFIRFMRGDKSFLRVFFEGVLADLQSNGPPAGRRLG